jgi:hypothetical protein
MVEMAESWVSPGTRAVMVVATRPPSLLLLLLSSPPLDEESDEDEEDEDEDDAESEDEDAELELELELMLSLLEEGEADEELCADTAVKNRACRRMFESCMLGQLRSGYARMVQLRSIDSRGVMASRKKRCGDDGRRRMLHERVGMRKGVRLKSLGTRRRRTRDLTELSQRGTNPSIWLGGSWPSLQQRRGITET